MTPFKALLERALKCSNLLQDLPMHERSTVLQIVANGLQCEAKSLELAQLQPQPPASPIDEHYRA